MCLRLFAILSTVCLVAAAQAQYSAGHLVALVRTGIANHQSDPRLAKSVHRFKIAEQLDDRTIEILESEGAGPDTLEELLRLRDLSVGKPVPQKPPVEMAPAPAAEEQARVWKTANTRALTYTDSLPDFICNEVVKRSTSEDRDSWRLSDTLVLKLSYFDREEHYQLLTVNNRSTGMDYEEAGGAITKGEFGSFLSAVFNPHSRTAYSWSHWTTLRKRPTHVYSFRIAPENSDYSMTAGDGRGRAYQQTTTPGQRGFVYIDVETHAVMRIRAESYGMPRDFPIRSASSLLDYDFIDVGGHQYLLPLHAETRMATAVLQHRNQVSFLAYHKFAADATISFDGAPPVKK